MGTPSPTSPTPLRAALFGLVTALAVLLVCQTKIRALVWSVDYPQMSHQDPVRALFSFAEWDRRAVQAGAYPDWPLNGDRCTACNAAALEQRWRELFDEHQRYVNEGYRRRASKRWLREAEAARDLSLAGWLQPAAGERVQTLNGGDLPDYLEARRIEILQGDSEADRAGAAQVARTLRLRLYVHAGFILLALGVSVAYALGVRYPRRPARSRLAAPELGRGLVVFIWARGFVAVLTILRWDNPDGPFAVLASLHSLAPALAIVAMLIGTRRTVGERPVQSLFYCPPDRRSRLVLFTAALASLGVIYALNWVDWRLLHWLQVLSPWSDWVDTRIQPASPSEAALARINAVILAPFAEELMFRGVLFGSLAKRWSVHRAGVISSLIFAALHGYGWLGFFSVALSGYLWARLAASTGSLLPGTLAHGTFNLLAGLLRGPGS